MSAVTEPYLTARPALLDRLGASGRRLARKPPVVIGVASGALLLTFAAMVATGGSGPIGTIMFVPWVALIAAALGPVAGAMAGVAATALYIVAAEMVTLPADPVAVLLRLLPLVGVGVAAGFSSRRISSDAHELQATSALQQALLDSTVDGICLTDPTGRILFGNAPLLQFGIELGLPLHGTVTDRLLALADRTTEPVRFRKRMTELAGNSAESEDEFELNESGRVFRGYTAPVERADGTLVGRIWTLREVTADRQLERLRDAFLAAVSHELRTPLTSISGFVEMLGDEDQEHLTSAGRNYVQAIARGTARLQRIVEDLLLVAEIEADRLQLVKTPTDLGELTAATVEAALPTAAERGVELVLDVHGSLALEADAARLGQVLDNLVSNALKYTRRGGRVVVSATESNGNLRLEVADNGIGVPHEELGQLFSRFYRASSATRLAIPGNGLGLVIVRAIVERHGGTVSLDSVEGEGTRVTVSLPAG
jgi:signal transduction histidine kinase